MASKQYYIYEIPGVKIGCTENPKRRIETVQGYTNYKILEQHTDIIEASRREIELQKQYGYKVDTTPYYKIYEQSIKGGKKNVESGHIANLGRKYGKLAGKKNKESGHMATIQSLGKKIGGKIQGKKNKESGQIAALGKSKRKLTFEQAEEIREKFYKMDGGKMERYNVLASQYNVSNSAIRYIIQNKSYTEK